MRIFYKVLSAWLVVACIAALAGGLYAYYVIFMEASEEDSMLPGSLVLRCPCLAVVYAWLRSDYGRSLLLIGLMALGYFAYRALIELLVQDAMNLKR